MKLYICLCFIFTLNFNNISYGQSYECDNNFGDCGTPEQSGGGGGGAGSVLIANTDLGDTYQHADDYDDDGIEDPSDNCPRIMNTDQIDRDGDGIGDSCDNCLSVWNVNQENTDGDELGDFCDDDIDNDTLLNYEDDCPYHWGKESCFMFFEKEEIISNNITKDKEINADNFKKTKPDKFILKKENADSCNTFISNNNFFGLLLTCLFLIIRKIGYDKRSV
jgi:hypothetical protein